MAVIAAIAANSNFVLVSTTGLRSPASWHNLTRRHLNESQRAVVAARLANMKQGERTDLVQICTTSEWQEMEEKGHRVVFKAPRPPN